MKKAASVLSDAAFLIYYRIVNWDVLISMKINKVLSATLNMTLKYDNDVKTFNDEGVERGPKVQFKEILGIGLAYNF